jgi:hypothetical protein
MLIGIPHPGLIILKNLEVVPGLASISFYNSSSYFSSSSSAIASFDYSARETFTLPALLREDFLAKVGMGELSKSSSFSSSSSSYLEAASSSTNLL